MTQEEVVQMQIAAVMDAVGQLRTANEKQAEFNKEVVEFMATATTWGKIGLIAWLMAQGVLTAALVKALGLG